MQGRVRDDVFPLDVMERAGLDAGIEEKKRMPGHGVAAGPVPDDRICGVEDPHELEEDRAAPVLVQPVGHAVP